MPLNRILWKILDMLEGQDLAAPLIDDLAVCLSQLGCVSPCKMRGKVNEYTFVWKERFRF